MAKQRVFIIIDGNNFYHRLKEIRKGKSTQLDFDYKALSTFLSEGRKIVDKAYYVGAVREDPKNKKSKKLMIKQHQLIGGLIKMGFRIDLGYLLKTSDGYHEKGVDVKMGMDMLVGAYENKYDCVCLISSDTDLLPVIKKVKEMGKKVEYIGFSHKPSFGLIKQASEVRLLRWEDVKKFFKIKK